MNGNNQPQNFNNTSYNAPPQQPKNSGSHSGLGIAALILSILGCTILIGAILAIIDLTNKNGKNKILSKIALGICAFWFVIGLLAGLGRKKDKKDDSSSTTNNTEAATEVEDTPEDQLEDLAIGDSVTIRGVTVTVNSVTDTETSTGKPAYEVSITYSNHSGKMVSANPYDWSTVLHTGSDKAYVGGDESFNLENISDGEEWTGVVTLWNDDNAEKIKFESSDLNFLEDNKLKATWLLPDASGEEINDSADDSSEGNPDEEADYVITADEIGEYGKIVTLNENTDMPVDKYLYKLPAGDYKVTTDHKKLAGFFIVKDEPTTEPDNPDYPEVLDYVDDGDDSNVGSGYQLTAGDDDFNGNAKKEVYITLGEDESISIPGGYTTEVHFYFYSQK